MSACICRNIVNSKAGVLMDRSGKVLGAFHKECPEHGIEVVEDRPMRLIRVRQWSSKGELVKFRGKERVQLVQVSADKQRGLLEWIEWVPMDDPTPDGALRQAA